MLRHFYVIYSERCRACHTSGVNIKSQGLQQITSDGLVGDRGASSCKARVNHQGQLIWIVGIHKDQQELYMRDGSLREKLRLEWVAERKKIEAEEEKIRIEKEREKAELDEKLKLEQKQKTDRKT